MKHIKRRLLRTPRPYPYESLKGLIVRATEENGYDASTALLSLSDVRVDEKTKRTMYTERRWSNLSEMLNIDIPTLQDMACLLGIEETPPKAYNMFGHRIHKYSVRTTAPKICPGCLRESNYIRKIWDLAAFTCCPDHRTLLMEKCPSCGGKVSWTRREVGRCSCGQDWREVVSLEVTDAETILSRLISQVCGFSRDRDASDEQADGQEKKVNPLSSVGLSELLCAVYFIAGLQHGVVDATGKRYAVNLLHGELHEVLTNATAVFENWPENYYKFLDECRGKISTGSGQCGLYKDFGKLYDPLFIRKNNPLPEFMRDAFKKYITTHWDGGYAGWCGSISDDELKGKTYMTKWETMKYLGASLQTVNLLHKKGYLKGPYEPWVNRSRIMIEADSVRELKDRWDKSITAAQAGEMLGIGRIAVVSLVRNGCLVAIQGPMVTGQLEWKFEVQDVVNLLKLVEGKIPKAELEAGNPTVGFYKAIQKLSKLSIEVGEFVKLILDGKIMPVAKEEGSGLVSLLFAAGEIESFSKAEAKERRGTKRTMQEAARLLRTTNTEVLFLAKHGFLSAEKAAGGRGGTWAIAQEEIDRFSATYTTSGWLAHTLSTSTCGLSGRLMANGIMPVSGPEIDGGSIYFFKRADLEGVDLLAVLPKAKLNNIQKMNEKGQVNTKQLADITGFTVDQIRKIVAKGQIAPSVTLQGKSSEKGVRWFFSRDQIEKFKELKAEEVRQTTLFAVSRPAKRKLAA